MSPENTSLKDFRKEALRRNAPLHKLSVFLATMKQVISFQCASLAIYFLSGAKLNV